MTDDYDDNDEVPTLIRFLCQNIRYKVRLAEYNTSSYPTDVVSSPGGGFEYITVVIIGIERQIPHPNYKRYSATYTDDIGLVKLVENAPYTGWLIFKKFKQ